VCSLSKCSNTSEPHCWIDRVNRTSVQQVLIDREGVCTDGVGYLVMFLIDDYRSASTYAGALLNTCLLIYMPHIATPTVHNGYNYIVPAVPQHLAFNLKCYDINSISRTAQYKRAQ
jgi:hypothetical protein